MGLRNYSSGTESAFEVDFQGVSVDPDQIIRLSHTIVHERNRFLLFSVTSIGEHTIKHNSVKLQPHTPSSPVGT